MYVSLALGWLEDVLHRSSTGRPLASCSHSGPSWVMSCIMIRRRPLDAVQMLSPDGPLW